jgi:hypothetical protein
MNTPPVPSIPHPTISAEVPVFAREQGVEQYLAPLIELARQVYPSATRFEVFTEDDPEIANDRHIVFELDVPLSVDQSMRANRRWHEGAIRIEKYPCSCVFRLSVNLP